MYGMKVTDGRVFSAHVNRVDLLLHAPPLKFGVERLQPKNLGDKFPCHEYLVCELRPQSFSSSG